VLWQNKGEAKWGHVLQGASLGGATTHFIQSLKSAFKQKLDQNMLKNAYFWKKALKLSPKSHWLPAAGGSPQTHVVTPALLMRLCRMRF